jgi:hypothetical protein
VELIMNTRTWTDSRGERTRSLTEWHLACSPNVGRRRFRSEDERDAFVSESFGDLDLTDLNPAAPRERQHALHELVGRQLASVWFVADYVQLRFDEPPLNLYAMPAIYLADGTLRRPGDLGYADALVGQIGATLNRSDEFLDLGLVLDLDSGVRIATPLSEAPFLEIAEFSGEEGGWIWTGGAPPWESSEEAARSD